MAWTTPRTWIAGELVKETDLNAQIRDNQNILITSIDTSTGKIKALSSSYFASLDASNLTGIAKLASDSDHTAGVNDFNAGTGTRVVVPVGANKWGT